MIDTQYKKSSFGNADIPLLLFLIGATNVKLYVKVLTIAMYAIYVVHKRYKSTSINGFTKFYLLMPIAGTIAALLYNSFGTDGYWFGYSMAIFTWLLAALSVQMVGMTISALPYQALLNTIKVFFVCNALVSFAELLIMIIESGQLIPYWYWEPTEYYGGSTGDHIKGITGNISINNAGINAIGAIYFLYNKQLKPALLCTIVLLLCTSNLTLIILIVFLLAMLLLIHKKQVRLHVTGVLLTIGIVYPFLSYNNIKYVQNVYDTGVADKKEKALETEPLISANRDYLDYSQLAQTDKSQLSKSNYYVQKNDTLLISYKDDLKYIQKLNLLKSQSNSNLKMEPYKLSNLLIRWYGLQPSETPLSKQHGIIKIYSYKQTLAYLKSTKKRLFFGAGIGNFSSKQAIKSTGLGLQGSYPIKYIYISDDFLKYHLYTLLYVFSLPISEHSVINMPNSTYNQIAGEYGGIGLILFMLFYIGFILKNYKKLSYTWFIAPFFFIYLGFEYWFEFLSLTILFELLVLLDINKKENDAGA
ncbi:hypothetical protein CAP35_15400 [Chitinophagaceae bacterium IBVUCB1]|nr:hypothetical protein CAP35_15400 [Chitinophagaceae bacterium IBVUCB1]